MLTKLTARGAIVSIAGILAACGGHGGGDSPPPPPPATHSIGGGVTGLTGTGLVLHNSTGENLTVNANGTFTFGQKVNDGDVYSVLVQADPSNPAQACDVTNGSGTATANVTNVSVTCDAANGPFTVGGTVSGLLGSGLVLRNNGGDDTPIAGNGPFSFATPVVSGNAYNVTVATQPAAPAQLCTVANGAGSAVGNVNDVEVSCQVSTSMNDADGDGLTDDEEAAYGTNPLIADTDGDGFGDEEEARTWDRFGGGHLKLNPIVADVPRLYLRELGTPIVRLYATTTQSGSVEKGMTNSASAEVKKTVSRGQTNTHAVEEQHAVNVNAEVKQRGPITTGKVAASYDYNHNDTTTNTSYWNATTVATNRQASSEFSNTIDTETVTQSGGEIKVTMGVYNDGDVAWTLGNMELTALMQDPNNPGNVITVGTLSHAGALNFTPTDLGRRTTIADGELTPFVFTYTQSGDPQEIHDVLENSGLLELRPVNIQLTGSAGQGVDLNLAAQTVKLRTAEIIIDYGGNDAQGLGNERYHVAVDVGGNSKIDLATVMANHLNIAIGTGSFSLAGSAPHTGITSVRSVADSEAAHKYWLLAHQYQPPGSPPGTVETKLYNILAADFLPQNIQLGKGDTLHFVYIADTDLDGLSDRLEQLHDTDPNQSDTDGDGLDDALELFGWHTNLTAPPCETDMGSGLVLVHSDPLEQDTDGDAVTDDAEFAQCTNPEGDLKVELGPTQVVTRAGSVQLDATVSNGVGPLTYRWVQTAGTPIGSNLPGTASVTFQAPDGVTTLGFQVTATDTGQGDVVAVDAVQVILVDNPAAALFVDFDAGKDTNSGTPTQPLRTLQRALTLAAGNPSGIYMKTPSLPQTYPDTLVVPADTSLYGGFGADWLRNVNAPTPLVVLQPTGIRITGSSLARLSGLSVQPQPLPSNWQSSMLPDSAAIDIESAGEIHLDNVSATGGEVTWSDDKINTSTAYYAGSSYGVKATGVDHLFVDSSLIGGGIAANGVPGAEGAQGLNGEKGGNASGTSGGGGGHVTGGYNGGSGGNGAGGGSCKDGNPGAAGTERGTAIDGSKGGGGRKGKSVATGIGLSCGLDQSAGTGGNGGPGRAGSNGPDESVSTTFDANGFDPLGANDLADQRRGATGGYGGGGGGGGGGAASISASGGGGGGGGEGGKPGTGGYGGTAGGASIGMLLRDVQFVDVTNSTITSDNGANGGVGGAGGAGGAGGGAGARDTQGFDGGNGGKGGSGGAGGIGGGGAGGPTAGLVLLGDTTLYLDDSFVTTGDAGTTGGSATRAWNYGVYSQSTATIPVTPTNVTFDIGAGSPALDVGP